MVQIQSIHSSPRCHRLSSLRALPSGHYASERLTRPYSGELLALPVLSQLANIARLPKDPRPFFSMLRLFCLALTLFDMFFYILQRKEDDSKALMQGCKFTWKSAFSQMWWHYQDAFDYLVTAGI